MWPVFAVSGRRKLEEEKRDEHELGGHLEFTLMNFCRTDEIWNCGFCIYTVENELNDFYLQLIIVARFLLLIKQTT